MDEDIIDEELENILIAPESKLWYSRVMKWTNHNKRAYTWIKLVQILACLTIFGATIAFFDNFKKTEPNEDLLRIVRLLIAMHTFDLLTYLVDLTMVCKRWKTMLAFRFMLSSISLTIGVVIQV